MNVEDLAKLKIAANQFYLEKFLDQPTISDLEYDSLKSQYEAEGGSVMNLVDWDTDMRRVNTPLPKVDKTQVGDNDLSNAVMKYVIKLESDNKSDIPFRHYVTYKYDGSSVIAYYTPEGKLQKILGTPDQTLCMDRTRNCWNMFPHQVNPGIECIQGEFLVDASYYGELARNKANGLLNSKDMIKELESEGFIRIYQMRFYDGNWSIERLMKELQELTPIFKKRIRNGIEVTDLIFGPAEQFLADGCPKEPIIQELGFDDSDNFIGPKFQVDGVVVYSTAGYYAFKFYYTESAVTTVTQVAWSLQDNGGYSCKIKFQPIKLNGKSISQASSGGVPNLMYMKMGKGAKVRVILSNMTIPKIIQVLEPSEDYQWPTCGCGYKLSEKDIFGSTLKCQSDLCSTKYDLWLPKVAAKIDPSLTPSERVAVFKDNIFSVLERALNIDRWDPRKTCKTRDMDKLCSEIVSVACNGTANEFIDVMKNNFNFTWLTSNLLKINAGTSLEVLRYYLKD